MTRHPDRQTSNYPKQTKAASQLEQQRGYLLIEVMITSVLLLLALLSIVPMYTTAMKQNAMARDLSIGSTAATDKAEEFAAMACNAIRRGTCCHQQDTLHASLASSTDGTCDEDKWQDSGMTYTRTCVVRQLVGNGLYGMDSDAAAHSFDVAGVAWIEVTVTPQRTVHLGGRDVKPSVVSYWRVCDDYLTNPY